jgi:hypothetical protein
MKSLIGCSNHQKLLASLSERGRSGRASSTYGRGKNSYITLKVIGHLEDLRIRGG